MNLRTAKWFENGIDGFFRGSFEVGKRVVAGASAMKGEHIEFLHLIYDINFMRIGNIQTTLIKM